MHDLVYALTYLGLVIFVVGVVTRIVAYRKNPMHLRWEIYPVAHEGGGKGAYGGGYLEEVDWWNKPRETSRVRELWVMFQEIFFIKALWEHHRRLWLVSFPFHIGLYLISGLIVMTLFGAGALLAGVQASSGLMVLIGRTSTIVAPIAFSLSLLGALGLLLRRVGDPGLRRYSAFEHYFNLVLFMVLMGVALITWASVDRTYGMERGFIASLVAFDFKAPVSPLFTLQTLLAVFTLAYIPFTHMSHFFMKYFLYHDIRWEDKPNVKAPEINEQIGEVLGYEPKWSAPHIDIPGKKTWADIALYNPAAEPKEDNKTEK
jgi:nitrate reductase gamma subunit